MSRVNRDTRLVTATLEHSSVRLIAHDPSNCAGEICSLHNRSNHSMRAFPQHWRDDRGIMERTCSHGVGHPDPDDIKIRRDAGEGLHACCGCCL